MEHQRFEGERTLMRIHIGESDKWHGKPLYQAVVELFRREGFSGVTVLRGVGGYGSSSRYHTDKILRLSDEVVVYPAHYGPHHGLPEDRFTTLGKERRFNEALTVKSKEDFIRYMMEGWPPKPSGWREISERNTSA